MATLTNTKIKDTYDGLLKTTDNDVIGITEKVITDGLGNASILSIGTQSASFSEDIEINGQTFGVGLGSVSSNVAIGLDSLSSNTTGSYNVAVGNASALSNTTGARNIAIGFNLLGNTTGNDNISLGLNSLFFLTGSDNIAIGRAAGQYSTGTLDKTAGDQNIYIGANTVSGGQDTDNEIVIGYNTTGNGSNTATYGNASITDHYFDGNVRADFFYGDGSNLTNLPTGAIPTLDQVTGAGATSSVNVTINGADLGTIGVSSNTLFGYNALASHTSGSDNIAIGYQALDAKTVGNDNVAIGRDALGSGTTISYNTAIGNEALLNISGNYNVALGHYAGKERFGGNKTLGDNNVYIGANTDSAAADTDNEIVIGANALGNGSNSATYGDSNVTKHIFTGGNVGIGTVPSAWGSGDDALELGGGNQSVVSGNVAMVTAAGAYFNGSNWVYRQTGIKPTLQTQSYTGEHIFYGATNGTAGNAITFSEAMRIDSSGNVSVGTASASFAASGRGNITIGGSSSSILGFQVGGTQKGYVFHDNNDLHLWNANAAGNLLFGVGSERMRIDSSGNIRVKGTNTKLAWERASDGAADIVYLTKKQDISTNGNAKLHGYDGIVFSTEGAESEKMRIDSSGNVGIGESNPAAISSGATTLHIKGTVASKAGGIRLRSSDNSVDAYVYPDSTNGMTLGTLTNHNVRFVSNSAERMRITSGGQLLINTQTLPNGTSAYGAGFAPNSEARTTFHSASNTTSSSKLAYFLNPNGEVGSIATSGSSTSYNTSSDYRLKENVEEMTGALDRVDALKPSRFNFIADPEKTVDGFLAHEVQAIVPEAVTGEKDAVDEEGNPIYQGIDQSKIVPLLVGAIKELRAEIELLKSQLNA